MDRKSAKWQTLCGQIRTLGKNRRGQVITMAALLSPVLLAVMGLALDGGLMYHVKRRMQTAADAGAMGGAHELWRQNTTQVTPAAQNDAQLNGFDDKNSVVTVNHPPLSGPRAGNANFVEVIITQEVPTFFMRVVNRQSSTVRARAVAGLVSYAEGCVTALNPAQRGALTIEGTATLTAGCGVMVDSRDDQAIRANGGGCIYAGEVGVSGNFVTNGSSNCINPVPTTEVPPAMDPLGYLTPPPISLPAIAVDKKITGGTETLDPGLYLGGLDISGGTVTFNPGVYILDGGGMKVSGNAIINGNGVMFYNTNTSGAAGKWGDIDVAGTVTVNLKAPDSGPYEGVLFWNDRNAPDRNPGSVVAGTSGSKFEGALYFPSSHLTYTGTSSTADWTMIIADTITISGNSVVNSNYGSSPISPPTRKATLVE